jgi:polar amino acid transport system permease protein
MNLPITGADNVSGHHARNHPRQLVVFAHRQYPSGPLGGLAMTMILALLGLALAFPLGVLLAMASVCPNKVLRASAIAFVTLFRGLPLLLLIFWAYFLLPAITGYSVSAFSTMITALVFYQSAYMAEVVRSGIQGLPSGQSEASSALGFNFFQRMMYFILPQALRAMLPSLISQFVSIVKDTSLGYVISVSELTFVANQLNSSLLTRPFQVFGILAITYFILCFSLASLARWIDLRLSRQKHPGVETVVKAETATA